MLPGETSTAQFTATSSQRASSHEEGLQRQLTAGQMAMVAVGGSIGTGLLLGSAAAIEVAGPAVLIPLRPPAGGRAGAPPPPCRAPGPPPPARSFPPLCGAFPL